MPDSMRNLPTIVASYCPSGPIRLFGSITIRDASEALINRVIPSGSLNRSSLLARAWGKFAVAPVLKSDLPVVGGGLWTSSVMLDELGGERLGVESAFDGVCS